MLLAAPLLFGLGAYLALRTIAALYRILDLWYDIGRAWPGVARAVVACGGATVLFAALLPLPLRIPLLSGFAAYVAFYLVSGLLLVHVFIPRVRRGRGP